MTIESDFTKIHALQLESFALKGKYIIGLATPIDMPNKGSISNVTEFRPDPNDPTNKIVFAPASKDYQFRVGVHETKTKNGDLIQGYQIIAHRRIDENTIEQISTEIHWDQIPDTKE